MVAKAPRSRGGGGERVVDPKVLLERVNNLLYERVGQAAQAVHHLETTWSPGELTKRVVRYIYNAACKAVDAPDVSYEEATEKFVTSAMHSYNASCGEKDWFFEIDLIPAFTAAAYELVQGQRGATFQRVNEKVCTVYEAMLDSILLSKAMWEATSKTFPVASVQGKVFAAVQKGYEPAYQDTLNDMRPRKELERVEDFLRRWLEDTMKRAWNSVEESEKNLNPSTVSRLFQNLLAPFGEDHQFSCVPTVLTEHIGPPPRKWAFVSKSVKELFDKWRRDASTPAAKRRKTSGGSEAPQKQVSPVRPIKEAVEDDGGEDGMSGDAEGDVEGDEGAEGHPACTSQEDCIGTPDSRLVRHLLNGKRGDVYCKKCWESFLQANPTLEGEED